MTKKRSTPDCNCGPGYVAVRRPRKAFQGSPKTVRGSSDEVRRASDKSPGTGDSTEAADDFFLFVDELRLLAGDAHQKAGNAHGNAGDARQETDDISRKAGDDRPDMDDFFSEAGASPREAGDSHTEAGAFFRGTDVPHPMLAGLRRAAVDLLVVPFERSALRCAIALFAPQGALAEFEKAYVRFVAQLLFLDQYLMPDKAQLAALDNDYVIVCIRQKLIDRPKEVFQLLGVHFVLMGRLLFSGTWSIILSPILLALAQSQKWYTAWLAPPCPCLPRPPPVWD